MRENIKFHAKKARKRMEIFLYVEREQSKEATKTNTST